MSEAFVTTEQFDAVRVLRLNRPEARNSLSLAQTGALRAALAQAVGDSATRAVVIASTGKSFCAGGDLKEMQEAGDGVVDYVDGALREAHNPLIAEIAECPKPVICAAQGKAAGAGVGLAFAGDLTVAADDASFLLPFVPNLAIAPDAGSSWVLPRALGYRRALGLVLTGQPLSAAEAHQAGLVWALSPADQLDEDAVALATRLAVLSRDAVIRARRLLRAAASQDLACQLELEHQAQLESFAHPAAREGLAAIAARRRPDFAAADAAER